MHYRKLGQTDLDVSVVSFGTGPLGNLFGDIDEMQAQSVVGLAIDQGINFFDTAPYYGAAEERLGRAIRGRRENLVIGTKAGRYGNADFDFSPKRIRAELENSLRLLQTDHVDILQLHDIEYGNLDQVLTEAYETLVSLRDAGKCRFIGVTGYSLSAMRRALNETKLDVLLTYAHGTLLDDSLSDDLFPIAEENGVGLINAAAVALGLLTAKTEWFRRDIQPDGTVIMLDHPATPEIKEAAVAMARICAQHGEDISRVATQYAIQRVPSATTLVGTAKASHLEAAVAAATDPIDQDLLDQLLALRPPNGGWLGIGDD